MKILDALIPARSQRMNLAEAYFGAGNGLTPFGLDGYSTFSVGGQTYTVPIATTMPGQKTEGIANSFEGYVLGGLAGNSIVYSLAVARLRVFAQARFQFQRFNKGRPGDLFATPDLSILERPWPGGVTGDLLAMMILHADFAGNAYVTLINSQLVLMRPDCVDILLAERPYTDDTGHKGTVGMEKVGYLYYQGGKASGVKPMAFLADQVCHFCPMPDPLAWYRGMSWLTPVVREIQADQAAQAHKLKFFDNAATPNVAVKLQLTDPTQFKTWVAKMEEEHSGIENAYKTLYTGAGADVTVIGKDMRQMDFANVIAAGEVRLAAAAGVPASVAGISEGLQGSSLNAGNYAAQRRQFTDTTLSHLWANVAGCLEVIVRPPHDGTRLWYDLRDIPFLREDQKDAAAILQSQSQAIRELFMAGFTPDSIVAAVLANDFSLLVHTGTYSIQVQAPGVTSTKLPSTTDQPPTDPEGSTNTSEVPALAATSTNGNGATP